MPKFGTAGIRGPVTDDVTPEIAVRVGRAVAQEGTSVAVARDGRETSPALMDAAVAGLVSGGASVERLGILPTPALAFASRGRLGVMITASHNPPRDNGIKLFADAQEFDRSAEQRIERRLGDRDPPVVWDEWGTQTSGTVRQSYLQAVVGFLDEHGASPDGLSVAVDCGNGTAGLGTPPVLRSLGADVRSLNETIDGHFPARPSKPTAETLETLRTFVATGPAQLGIAHDGDADRIVVVDREGEVIHEDTVLAIVAEHYVRQADTSDPIVLTTPNASNRIDERVQTAGGRVERSQLGGLHEGIARIEADETEANVVFAAEPWKHLHPAFGGWIDGIVSAGLLVKLAAETDLETRREAIRELPYRKESLECSDSAKTAVMQQLAPALRDAFPSADVNEQHGLRLTLEDGWLLVRPSGTEPKLRLYGESERVDDLLADLRDVTADIIDDLQRSP